MAAPLKLNTPWTLHYDYQQRNRATNENWNEVLKTICTVDTLPMFLYAVDEIQAADCWPLNSNIHMFREGIQPAWEDEKNVKGGKWVCELKKEEDTTKLNQVWQKTLGFCASEQVPNVCGCVFSPRKHVDRIAVWTDTCDEKIAMVVGEKWNELCGIDITISFKAHENALKGLRDRGIDLYKI